MRVSYFVNLVTTIFTAGAMLLQFLTVLSGTKDYGILNRWYWLEVDTSRIEGASPITRYNLWGYCTRDGTNLANTGNSTGCAPVKLAYAFQPDKQFDGANEVPQWFEENHNRNYWLTRLLFPWFIIALAFETPVLFFGLCSSAKRRFGVLSSLLTLIAFLFQASAAAMATVAYVQGRDQFQASGNDAKIGIALQAFVWVPTFLLFVNVFLFCCIRPHHAVHDHEQVEEGAYVPPAEDHISEGAETTKTGDRFFKFRNKEKEVGDDSSFVRAY